MDIITLKEAKELELKRYFTGNPCKNGHYSERNTSSRGCIECTKTVNKESRRASNKAWRMKNKKQIAAKDKLYKENNQERVKANKKRWYQENRSKVLESTAEWRVENLEASKEYHKEWRKRNRLKSNEANRAYYKALTIATPAWTKQADLDKLYLIAKELTRATGVEYCLDHSVPITHKDICGLRVVENIRIITRTEDNIKKNKFNAREQEVKQLSLINKTYQGGI